MIYRFVIDGGTWMLPILAASVIGLAFILERSWYWFVSAVVRDRGLRERLRAGEQPPPAQTVRDPVARVLIEAVRRPDDLGIASARAEAILRESKAYLNLLRFTGGTAALVGLLGTTLGIREAFRATTTAPALDAEIANALHATILGLAVFIAIHTASALFQAFSASLARELDEHLDEVARILRRGPIVKNPTPASAESSAPGAAPEKPIGKQTPAPAASGPPASELADTLAGVGGD